jgi:hypothetical protein
MTLGGRSAAWKGDQKRKRAEKMAVQIPESDQKIIRKERKGSSYSRVCSPKRVALFLIKNLLPLPNLVRTEAG